MIKLRRSSPARARSPAGAATTADRVQDRLRGDILSGVLRPGARITVEELAARYAVSQMPVREAIRVLAGEGVIETSPHRGARIVAVDGAFIRNVYDMREALEGMLAERCAERADGADVARLRAIIAAHATAVQQGDLGQVVLLDRRLHLLVAEIAANPLACRAITIGRGLIEALRMRTGFSRPRLARIIHEHDALVSAVEARDSRTAGLVARLHVVGARDDLVRALAAEA